MPPIIAEDLGQIDDNVKGFLDYCGFPGLKVLQFAFDEQDSTYLPHNNDKKKRWFLHLVEETK